MFKLAISNTITVPIKGSIPDDKGGAVPFNFTLRCKRLKADELKDAVEQNDRTLAQFMADITEGWDGVADAEGNALPYSRAALDELFNIVGMVLLVFQAYMDACGAKGKAKN